jgi:hypothetical protein
MLCLGDCIILGSELSPRVVSSAPLTHPLLFVDDLHLGVNENGPDAGGDSVLALLKSLLEGIMHCALLTDPRTLSSDGDCDCFFPESLCLLAAASLPYHSAISAPRLRSLMPHMLVLTLPDMSSTELSHLFSIGVFSAVRANPTDGGRVISAFYDEISTLIELTIDLGSRLKVFANRSYRYKSRSVERVLSYYLEIDLAFIKSFCGSLYLLAPSLTSPSALLGGWLHEWRRHFSDLLPRSPFQEYVYSCMKSLLDELDHRKWFVSRAWFTSLAETIDKPADYVYTSMLPFWSGNRSLSASISSTCDESYFHYCSVFPSTDCLDSVNAVKADTIASLEISFDFLKKECVSKASVNFVNLISLSPTMLSLFLRLLRSLSVYRRHVVTMGYLFDSTRFEAAQLAASLEQKKFLAFSPRGSPAIVETVPSEKSIACANFKRFLKYAVLMVIDMQYAF